MTEHRLAPLLSPRSIAFVGASARPDTPGRDMMRAIRRGGFGGRVTAVNPNYAEIEGYPCVGSLAELPAPPDLAVLAVRNDRLEASFAEAVAAGARAAVIFASGHLQGDRDPPLSARLAAMSREAGVPVCGPNCMGFYNDADGVWICGFPSSRTRRPGSVALVAHSGSVFGALLHNDPRLRVSFAVSPGQELGATVADYLDYAVERPEVKVVGLFMETARDPAGFEKALKRAAERQVPVVVLKAGRTEAAARAALTHTGALAGSDAAFEALFDRYGVIRVETLDALAATLLLMSTGRRAAPGGLATIHDSGGERELFIDLAERHGVPWAEISQATKARLAARLEPGLLPENPLDAWGTGRDYDVQFGACFADLVADPATGLGIFAADIRDSYYLSDGFAAAARSVAEATDKPVALATNYTQLRHDAIALALTEAGVPVLDGTENALIAARGAMRWRDFLARGRRTPPAALPEARAGDRAAWLAQAPAGRRHRRGRRARLPLRLGRADGRHACRGRRGGGRRGGAGGRAAGRGQDGGARHRPQVGGRRRRARPRDGGGRRGRLSRPRRPARPARDDRRDGAARASSWRSAWSSTRISGRWSWSVRAACWSSCSTTGGRRWRRSARRPPGACSIP